MADGTVRCIDSEIPFDIPDSWEWVRLGSIFNHTSGKQQSSSNKCGGTPQRFITTSNLYWGRFVLDNVKIMNFTDDEIKTCSATKGDLLVCEGGAGYGRSAIWCYDYDICLQNHVHRLRPYVNGTCEYVYHFIYFLKETNQLAAVGTAMPGLSANRLKGLLMPLPPINEQQRIVAKLLNLEDYIHHYTAMDIELSNLNNDVNSKIYKSILQEAIQGRLVLQIESEGTAEELLDEIRAEKKRLVKEGKLKKSVLANESRIFRGEDNRYYEQIGETITEINVPFELPTNWAFTRLRNLCQLTDGDKREGTEVNLDTKYLRGKGISYISKGRYIEKGERLILVDGENSGEVFTAPLAGYMGSTFKKLWIVSYMLPDFLLLFLRLYKELLRNSKKGAAIPHLNKELFYGLLIGLPPNKEQIRIVNQVSVLLNVMK